jgi:hypothetical protein
VEAFHVKRGAGLVQRRPELGEEALGVVGEQPLSNHR